MIECIIVELENRKNYLNNDLIETIYFGGGTPSLLEPHFIETILNKIYSTYKISDNAEITLEANPDDLDKNYLYLLKRAGINRLSIGIQSFDEHILKYLNRIHNAESTINCVEFAQNVGFENISIDLIYGIPNTDEHYWKKTLSTFSKLNVQHLSAYCLTIEPKTVFGNYLKKGKINPIEENIAHSQHMQLIDYLPTFNFEQYEISNFSLKNYHSRHNSSYWFQIPYLGIGPGAHSYNNNERTFNISNNNLYIQGVKSHQKIFELESLTIENIINESIMTGLRTKWGCDLNYLKEKLYCNLIESDVIKKLVSEKFITENKGVITLTKNGIAIADNIILEIIINNGF